MPPPCERWRALINGEHPESSISTTRVNNTLGFPDELSGPCVVRLIALGITGGTEYSGYRFVFGLCVKQSLQVIRKQSSTFFADPLVADIFGRGITPVSLHPDRILLSPKIQAGLFFTGGREPKG